MREILEKYSDTNYYDLSCSEKIIRSANEFYKLGLTDNAFKMMAPFSGGMYEGEACGIMTASISVLGILYTDGVSHTSPVLREAVVLFKQKFRSVFGSTMCDTIVATKRDEVTGCTNLIIEGGILLEATITEIDNTYHITRRG